MGELLGSYRLIRLLGEGGFAQVYLGEHLHLGTLAAIKVLRTTLASEEIDAFRREAQTIARLEHPHIVRVLDYNVQGGTPYLVMGFAPGGTLRTRHPRGSRLPLPTILNHVAQVAEALQYAHENRVIHRDIKPENLLVGRNNEVLLSDFGIALFAQSSQLHGGTQNVIGTAAYMAPEQFRGKPCKASDQYALAVIVYEWLAGGRPFSGSFVELASQHMYAAPPPLQGKAAVSPAVERVVLTALTKDPGQRYGSVSEFAVSLEQAAHALSPTLPAGKPGVDQAASTSAAPTLLAISPTPGPPHPDLAIPMRQVQVDGAAAPGSAQRPRSRRTARVRAICFGLVVVSILLWLATFTVPVLHSWFAGAILFSLVFWIAAYADHRRVTEPSGGLVLRSLNAVTKRISL